MKKILIGLICLTCLSSCTIDSVSVSTGHIPYYREVRAVPARVYYYDLRPDYIRYRYGRPRRIHYR
jgi:hypothetical protein